MALVHFVFYPPPHQIYTFSVCIKCQVNFLGAMKDMSFPSVYVDCGRVLCIYVCVPVHMGKWETVKGNCKAKERQVVVVQYSIYKLVLYEE